MLFCMLQPVAGNFLEEAMNKMVKNFYDIKDEATKLYKVINSDTNVWAEACTPPPPKSSHEKVCPLMAMNELIYYSAKPATVSNSICGRGAFQLPPAKEFSKCCGSNALCYSNCTLAIGVGRAAHKEECDFRFFSCAANVCGARPQCMLDVIKTCERAGNALQVMDCTLEQSDPCGGGRQCRFQVYNQLFYATQMACNLYDDIQNDACKGCQDPPQQVLKEAMTTLAEEMGDAFLRNANLLS